MDRSSTKYKDEVRIRCIYIYTQCCERTAVCADMLLSVQLFVVAFTSTKTDRKGFPSHLSFRN